LKKALFYSPIAVFHNPRRAEQVEAAERYFLAVQLLDDLRRRFLSFWTPLEKLLSRGTVSPERGDLARLRVIAPMLDWQHSAGIERAGFTNRELQRLIKAGVTRECIMLRREPDVIRATFP
jgi:hypothetical protein